MGGQQKVIFELLLFVKLQVNSFRNLEGMKNNDRKST